MTASGPVRWRWVARRPGRTRGTAHSSRGSLASSNAGTGTTCCGASSGRRDATARDGGRCRAAPRPRGRRRERDRARVARPASTRGGSRRNGRRRPGASRADTSSGSHRARGCRRPLARRAALATPRPRDRRRHRTDTRGTRSSSTPRRFRRGRARRTGSAPAGCSPTADVSEEAKVACSCVGASSPHGHARSSSPRAARSHCASLGRKPPAHVQNARASSQET